MLVVDASVAVMFVTEEAGSDAASTVIASPRPLIAPDWLLLEASSALWKKVRDIGLSPADAQTCLEAIPDFFARFYPASELLDAAFSLALSIRHPVYDCLYLALAQREEAALVTADKRFYDAVTTAGQFDHMELLTW